MRTINCLLLLFCLAGCAPGEPSQEAKPMNIVLIMTDDQGYGDIAAHGNPWIKTPNLDALHDESIRFTNFHVATTCAPTRAGLLSGVNCNRAGAWHTIGGRSLLATRFTTIAEELQSAGYATGIFGKWHLGDNYPFRPQDRLLTAHDWHTKTGSPWNQNLIRAGKVHNGYWALDVAEAGEYAIKLYRWPPGVAPAYAAAVPPMDPVPGGDGYAEGIVVRPAEARGRIGDRAIEFVVDPGAETISATLELAAGAVDLQTWITDDVGVTRGAYYIEIERLTSSK